jgi:membrane-bound lytic murein transglycosylase D
MLKIGQVVYIPTRMPDRKKGSAAPTVAQNPTGTRDPGNIRISVTVDTIRKASTPIVASAQDSIIRKSPVFAADTPKTAVVESTPAPEVAIKPAPRFYKVKSGDNLAKIAKRNDITLAQLRKWNKIGDSDVIQPGQKLKISAPEIENLADSVTPPKPAKKVTPPAVKPVVEPEPAPQPVDSTKVTVADAPKTPDTYKPTDAVTSMENGPAVKVYKIKKGDSLWTIASNHKITVNDLKKLNKLRDSHVIKPGDKLLIPVQ